MRQVRADRAHHDLAGVEADADLDRGIDGPPRVLRVPPHGVLHAERGIAGAQRVVLVGERGAEQGHDAVAHHLVHRPLVAVDGLHHQLEHGIEDLAGLLRVAVRQQLHRALEVCEEDRYLFAFTFDGGFRREDPFGQVLRGVSLRSGRTGLGGRVRHHSLAALKAESGAARQFGTT
jgi:hypothetical protein